MICVTIFQKLHTPVVPRAKEGSIICTKNTVYIKINKNIDRLLLTILGVMSFAVLKVV